MSRVLYLDCFSGISGDMMLGALLDAGLPLDELRRALGSLAVGGFEIDKERVLRAGVSATKFIVRESPAPGAAQAASAAHHHAPGAHQHGPGTPHHSPGAHDAAPGPHQHGPGAPAHSHDHDHAAPGTHHHSADQHRSLSEIRAVIDRSSLASGARERAKAMFHRLAEAEASIHQMSVDEVHLHEVGALDSIIDIVGTVFGLEWFGADRIVASPLNVGGGTVHSAHGLLPVPAPATLRLLGGVPIYGGQVQRELVTPTGALIVSSYATAFGPVPPMTVECAGYGAGDADFASTPNVLRVVVGREAAGRSQEAERVVVIECEIDDMNPQIFAVAMERLYAAGALEVFYAPVQMKKNRPGTLLTVVGAPERRAALSEIIFRETTTIGLRFLEMDRECLPRETISVETPLGPVRMKLARRGGRVVNASPEFEDCVKLAEARQVSVKEVQMLAVKAYGGFGSQSS